MGDKSPEAEAWSVILGQNVRWVHDGVPIIEVPSIEDLAVRSDWPERRAELRQRLRDWWIRSQMTREAMHGG